MRESGKAKTVQSTQDVIQNNKTALDAVAVVVEDVSCFVIFISFSCATA